LKYEIIFFVAIFLLTGAAVATAVVLVFVVCYTPIIYYLRSIDFILSVHDGG
jgi:hypothetical protein